MPFDLLFILQYFKYFAPSIPPTSKSNSIYTVDSNMKSSNYMKIQLNGLMYFALGETLN